MSLPIVLRILLRFDLSDFVVKLVFKKIFIYYFGFLNIYVSAFCPYCFVTTQADRLKQVTLNELNFY